MELDKMFDALKQAAAEICVAVFNKNKEVEQAMIHCSIDRNLEIGYHFVPDNIKHNLLNNVDRKFLLAFIQTTLEGARKITPEEEHFIVVITEAWTAKEDVPKEQSEAALKKVKKGDYIKPSQRPDRKEIIMIMIYGETEMRTYSIPIKDEPKRHTSIDYLIDFKTHYDKAEGEMVMEYDQPETTH